MKMAHYLINQKDEIILELEAFDRNRLLSSIVEYLLAYPEAELTHEKTGSDKRYYGNDILNFYQNKNGKPCRVIVKPNREYYKPLTFSTKTLI